jgi:transcriptional regulator with XRE-family HTH domain
MCVWQDGAVARQLGALIKEMRESDPKWSLKRLASEAGVSMDTIQRAEADRNLRVENLSKISAALSRKTGRNLFAEMADQPPVFRADQHDEYTPTPPGPSTPAPEKSERTMLDEEERTILMGMMLGVIKHHPHAFTRLYAAIKDATDHLHEELRDEAQATQAREAKVVGKN